MTSRQLAIARSLHARVSGARPGDLLEIEQRELHALLQCLWAAVERVAELEGRRERRMIRRAEGRALALFQPNADLDDAQELGPDFVGRPAAAGHE